ncbi:prepilin-type N-terminal cleavage/methylation domain-containing protein [Legionella sp. MW5194]|uniref:GspH/FimT family pseudopilin n=1 Tax=Legionella sp. MW5194 TaxID=2662448 RepID=UPI00193D9100|nr:prepilin-type N-terminal cleavage/methylation domain-containing protein [Legionella sp. MW5194]
MTTNSRQQAFSLVELLVSLALFTLLLSFYLGMNANNQLKTQLTVAQHRLTQAMHYARNQALVKRSVLILHPMEQGNWAKGMVLFKDPGEHRFNHQEVVYEWHDPGSPLTITWSGFHSPDALVFSHTLRHAAANGYFSISYQGVELGRVIINRLGRLRVVHYI